MTTTTKDSVEYLGSVDDEVYRTPFGRQAFDEDFIKGTLTSAALFGSHLLINDGYLMLTPPGRKFLMETDWRFLAVLMEAEHVLFYSRTAGKLDELQPYMAGKGVRTYVELPDRVREEGYSWEDFQNRLREISGSQSFKFWEWPKKDVGTGYLPMLMKILDSPPQDLMLEDGVAEAVPGMIKEFEAKMGNREGTPRQNWTDIVENHTPKGSPSHRRLVWIANEAYHYNMAASAFLTDEFQGKTICVQTRNSRAFSAMQSLPLRHDPDINRKMIFINEFRPKITQYLGLYEGAALERSLGNENLQKAKEAYLKAVDSYILGDDCYQISGLRDASDQYTEALIRQASALQIEEYRWFSEKLLYIGTTIGAIGDVFDKEVMKTMGGVAVLVGSVVPIVHIIWKVFCHVEATTQPFVDQGCTATWPLNNEEVEKHVAKYDSLDRKA